MASSTERDFWVELVRETPAEERHDLYSSMCRQLGSSEASVIWMAAFAETDASNT